jgi:hypothetical protein
MGGASEGGRGGYKRKQTQSSGELIGAHHTVTRPRENRKHKKKRAKKER